MGEMGELFLHFQQTEFLKSFKIYAISYYIKYYK